MLVATMILLAALIVQTPVYAVKGRLKNLVSVKGVRKNPLVGYGIVIGLDGTGDDGGEMINGTLKKMFQKLGLNPQKQFASKNIAAVVVTASMPPFARIGQKVDITISSVGEASSLAGGTLVVTPLKGGDGKIYAVASGPLSIGGLENGKKFPTTGMIPSGATVEREVQTNFHKKKALRLSLNNPDFTTAARIQKILNRELGGKYASARDATTVDLIVPNHYQREVVSLLAIIENFNVHTDAIAKIVINERTGTIAAGGDIRLNPVAISHGNLTIEVEGGKEGKGGDSLYYVKKKTSLNDLVKALNAMGATPDDLIAILQTLKKNGALLAEIEII
ncbi:MAG: flagellar basal body P-ring protein FlgI [Bdellovibrionales bacterium]|jgi:flagellar P-ring protein FlgI|nr:flagellar basal body P-ring protein FlgI [Bdellovibrionales bacterium]MBT3527398.1 flagellar basal body P-ring protein FlgI [Bdellovibrionales bacterium]